MLETMKPTPVMNKTELPVEPADLPSQDLTNLQLHDSELVRASRAGEMEAYDQLVQRYQDRIYATIYHMTSNHEDANDLAQETFASSWLDVM